MLSQQGGWLWARDFDDPFGHSVTVQVKNRNVFAEIALHDVWVLDEDFHSSLAYITQIVSDSGVEDFTANPIPLAFRKNVTSITFRIDVINCHASARWLLNFWS